MPPVGGIPRAPKAKKVKPGQAGYGVLAPGHRTLKIKQPPKRVSTPTTRAAFGGLGSVTHIHTKQDARARSGIPVPTPRDTVIGKAERGKKITNKDQKAAIHTAKLYDRKNKLNPTPKAPHYLTIQQAAAKHGFSKGGIGSMSTLDFIKSTGKDLVSVPVGIGESAEAVGKAAFESGKTRSLSPFETLGKQAWDSSLYKGIYDAAKSGDPKKWRALNSQFNHHPITTTMQLVPLGKLGAVKLTEDAAPVARELAPAAAEAASKESAHAEAAKIDGEPIVTLHGKKLKVKTAVTHPTYILKARAAGIKKLAGKDTDEAEQELGAMRVDTRAKETANAVHAATTRMAQDHANEETAKFLKTMKKTKHQYVRDLVGRAVNGQIATKESAKADLLRLQTRIKERLDSHTSKERVLRKGALDRTKAQLAAVDKLLNSRTFDQDINQLFEMKDDVVKQTSHLGEQQAKLGTLPESQIDNRVNQVYAMEHMGARKAGDKDYTQQHYEYKDIKKNLKTARSQLQVAKNRLTEVTAKRDLRLSDAAKNGEVSPTRVGYQKAVERQQTRVQELTTKVQRLQEAEKLGKKFNKQTHEGMVTGYGRDVKAVSPARIQAHMAENEVTPLGYLSEQKHGDENVYGASKRGSGTGGSRGDAPRREFTGASIEHDDADHSAAGMLTSILKQTANVDAARAHDIKLTAGQTVARNLHPDVVEQVANRYEHDHGIKLRAVFQHAAKVTPEQVSKMAGEDGVVSTADMQKALQFSPEAAKDAGLHSIESRVALIPDSYWKRLETHADLDSSRKFNVAAKVNSALKKGVLPFSPKYYVGNHVEAAFRTALHANSPAKLGRLLTGADNRFYKNVANSLTDDDRREFESLVGTHHGLQTGYMNSSPASLAPKYAESKAALAKITNDSLPVIQKFTAAMRTGIQDLYKAAQSLPRISGKYENIYNRAVTGAEMRKFAKSWDDAVKGEDDYFHAVATKSATPKMAEELARKNHAVLGQYAGFPPQVRMFVESIAPFAPWYMNSMKFMYYTLPAEHVLTSAALAALSSSAPAMQNLNGNGSAPFAISGWGRALGDEATGIKLPGNKYVTPFRYLPWGADSSGPADAISSTISPTFTGAIEALQGNNPYGTKLKGSAGKADTPEAMKNAIVDMFSEFTPGATLYTQAKKKGILGALNPTPITTVDPDSDYSGSGSGSTPNLPGGSSGLPGGVSKLPGGSSSLPGGNYKLPGG